MSGIITLIICKLYSINLSVMQQWIVFGFKYNGVNQSLRMSGLRGSHENESRLVVNAQKGSRWSFCEARNFVGRQKS